jgi:hypothetical protein
MNSLAQRELALCALHPRHHFVPGKEGKQAFQKSILVIDIQGWLW